MRRWTPVIAGLAALALAGMALQRPQAQGQALGFAVGPYLMHVTRTSIVVMWETTGPATSVVEYGPCLPLTQRASAPGAATIHEVRIEGLQPGAGYVYRVRSADAAGAEVVSDALTLKTAPEADAPIAFVVVGDSRTYPDRWATICRLCWAERPDFAVHVGDVVTNGTVKEQWAREWLVPALPLMSRVPMYVAIGNHERNAHWYYDYVSYPPPENYYSFDYGGAHFAMVDSNQDLSPDSRQYRWLERDLASSRARWKFVAHHHPQYSSDDDYGNDHDKVSTLGDDNPRKIIPLLERYRVDMVFVGHIHDYERTWPIRAGRLDPARGVIYVQTGGGGAELEDFLPIRSWFTAKLMSGWEYCYVAIAGGRLRLMAYDIQARMFDYLDLAK